jgi:hypothetical protein
MLIRYKENKAALNNIYDVVKNERVGYSDNKYIEFIYFDGFNKLWYFETQEERDKVYNLIMNNYFTDIEGLTNDN